MPLKAAGGCNSSESPFKGLASVPGTHTTYCHGLIARLPALISLKLHKAFTARLWGADGQAPESVPGGAGQVVPAAQPGLGTGSSAGA